MTIDTDRLSERYRSKMIDLSDRRILISRLAGSDQEHDLSEPPNANGLGRVRHFRRDAGRSWVPNPLPIDPARAALGLERADAVNAEVFQNAACNWRCWYCFVPFDMLAAVPARSCWATADELVHLYASIPDRPPVLDLSGGQPDLTPEWVLWTMEALERTNLASSVYLWSDDNLSNDYVFRYLSPEQRDRMARYRLYGRVACFKGLDADSFAFNTEAHPDLYERQFELFGRLLGCGFDLYAYVTFTHPHSGGITDRVARFVDRLQAVDEALPLRTVPLQIAEFGPVGPRMDDIKSRAVKVGQYQALDAWRAELEKRFTDDQRAAPINSVRWRR